MKRNKTALTLAITVCALSFAASQQAGSDLAGMPANSTDPLGQTFGERADNKPRVLLAGSGSSHNFPRDFIKTDSETLTKAGFDVAGTLNGEEAVKLLSESDVIVFSGNDGGQWGTAEFQKALNTHADAGKGVVILHAASWRHPWDGGNYNKRFVAGSSPSHGWGDFEVDVNKPSHDVMGGVPEKFTIRDESYRHEFIEGADATVLATNGKGADEHASVWTVNDPKTRIVVITLGHDQHAHGNEHFQSILTNAVKWVGGGDESAAGSRHPIRVWTNEQGRETEARLVEKREGEIVIESKEGKRFTIDPATLSADDQKYLSELGER